MSSVFPIDHDLTNSQ
uniref:Uncharacterized protein n=1 Tax=Rhizophora mucronata TaxID=61149 RepID=A0A2P2QNW2_RHIMU